MRRLRERGRRDGIYIGDLGFEKEEGEEMGRGKGERKGERRKREGEREGQRGSEGREGKLSRLDPKHQRSDL